VAVVGVGGPVGFVRVVSLVAPDVPVGALATRKKFKVRAGGAGFDEVVLLIGFAGVFTFAGAEDVDLPLLMAQQRVTTPSVELNDTSIT